MIAANRAYLARWMPWAAAQTRESTVEFIRSARRRPADDGFQAALTCDGAIIGVVGFHSVNWQHGSTTIGYWLDERHQGGGLMTRAVRALVDLAFGEWGLHRVEIRAAIDNDRSRGSPSGSAFAKRACSARPSRSASATTISRYTGCSRLSG